MFDSILLGSRAYLGCLFALRLASNTYLLSSTAKYGNIRKISNTTKNAFTDNLKYHRGREDPCS